MTPLELAAERLAALLAAKYPGTPAALLGVVPGCQVSFADVSVAHLQASFQTRDMEPMLVFVSPEPIQFTPGATELLELYGKWATVTGAEYWEWDRIVGGLAT